MVGLNNVLLKIISKVQRTNEKIIVLVVILIVQNFTPLNHFYVTNITYTVYIYILIAYIIVYIIYITVYLAYITLSIYV